MVARIESFADVVQQRGDQEFFIVGQLVASQLEDLQTVVQHVAFRMPFPGLLPAIERQHQCAVNLKSVDLVFGGVEFRLKVDVGVLGPQKLLEFRQRRPLHRLAGD